MFGEGTDHPLPGDRGDDGKSGPDCVIGDEGYDVLPCGRTLPRWPATDHSPSCAPVETRWSDFLGPPVGNIPNQIIWGALRLTDRASPSSPRQVFGAIQSGGSVGNWVVSLRVDSAMIVSVRSTPGTDLITLASKPSSIRGFFTRTFSA